jgi:hypothetical protein
MDDVDKVDRVDSVGSNPYTYGVINFVDNVHCVHDQQSLRLWSDLKVGSSSCSTAEHTE